MAYVPAAIWQDILWAYWTRSEPPLASMHAVVMDWIQQYGGPRTGLCLNILKHSYPHRDPASYRRLGEAIFNNWQSRGHISTNNGVEDPWHQFFWDVHLEQRK